MTWKKLENRHYKKETNEHGVDMIHKATLDKETGIYKECGRWVASEFADIPTEKLDGNTQNVRDDVIALKKEAIVKIE